MFFNLKYQINNILIITLPANQLKMAMSKKLSNSRVDKDGGVHQIQNYRQRLINTQCGPLLIEALSVDLDFDIEWMVELDDCYKKQNQQASLIGSVHLIIGPALSGKLGYVFWRKQQLLQAKLIIIDCVYHSTPFSFCIQLVEQLAIHLQKTLGKTKRTKDNSIQDAQQLTKRIAIEDQVKLSALDKHIKSRPNFKYIFVIKNADILVQQKKQTILYNFLDWIKTDINSQIGLVLITRTLDFVNKLQKRVRSRMNYRMLPIFGPKNQKVVKQALLKRFQYSLKSIQDDSSKKMVKKFIQLFQKSSQVDKIIKKQMDRCPKQMVYFLEFFKFTFAYQFVNDKKVQRMFKDPKQFDNILREGTEQARNHLNPYAKRQIQLFQQMQTPQFIVMAIIRILLQDGKPKISFKQIKKHISLHKQTSYSKNGTSFEFPEKVLERALQHLVQIKIIEMANKNDFENVEIYSNLMPEQIKQAIQGVQDLPGFLRELLN